MTSVEHWANKPKRREERDAERMRRASATAAADQRSAMAVALAQIGAAFDEAAIVNALKIQVEHFIRLGPQHPAVHARFSARAALFAGHGLDAAVIVAERWWRDERKAFQIACIF